MRSRMIFNTTERKHENPETPAPINNPQIIPTVNAYRVADPSSAVSENKPLMNSGDIKEITIANSPPRMAANNEPKRIRRKYPTAILGRKPSSLARSCVMDSGSFADVGGSTAKQVLNMVVASRRKVSRLSPVAARRSNHSPATRILREQSAVSRNRQWLHAKLLVIEATFQRLVVADDLHTAGRGDVGFHSHAPVSGVDDEAAEAGGL